jgi:proline dehydrogenase
MNIVRRAVLGVADNPRVSTFFRSSDLAKGLVSRFVAGETLDTALAVATDLAGRGITVTLDQLGENVKTEEEATAAIGSYVEILNRMHAAKLEPNISVKLTMLGLDLGRDVARDNMIPILEAARACSGFVRIDMEGSRYTEDTMAVFEELFARFPKEVGIVIQSYLRRAEDDIRRCIELGARVRLVKGAYAEPEVVAFQKRVEIDEHFARHARMLLSEGHYPAIATHDMALVRSVIEHTQRKQISPERFEFQMLYGVRRDKQNELVDNGYRMRVYVPYGREWYPYFSRRIAERPANALFVLRQLRG